MAKLVILTIQGTLELGFSATVRIKEEGETKFTEISGNLPSNLQLDRDYDDWRLLIRRGKETRMKPIPGPTNFSVPQICKKLTDNLNGWLDSNSFRSIRDELLSQLKPEDEVRAIAQVDEMILWRLPWHLWEIWQRYPKAEIAISSLNSKSVNYPETVKNKVNILAILGDQANIDIDKDRAELEKLPDANIRFLVEPKRQEINSELWEQPWDILFFAGHSRTDGETGKIFINEKDSLTVEELKYALGAAIGNGLKLAIFNSCDGLGLARELANLQIPQTIAMREPVQDFIAQEFVKYFLKAFAGGESLYLAFKQAREKLQGWEDCVPCASWLPVLCQNLAFAERPLHWQDLRDRSLTPTSLPEINPFDYGTPVSPKRFYGRSPEIQDVRNRIGAIEPQSISIVGMRRIGKTSLLRNIKECPEKFCQPQQKPLIVTIDFQNSKFQTPAGIIEGLRRGISGAIAGEPWAPDANDDHFAVENGLEALREEGYRLIVLLDEFERISGRLEEFQDWGDDWRAKASAGLLTMAIASLRPIFEIYKTLNLTSPFDNIFSQTILGSLDDDPWRDLVRDGFASTGAAEALSPESFAWIEDIAGGFPYYVKMAAAMLWQYRDFDRARAEFVFQANPRFRELWNDLTAAEREILKSIAHGNSVELNPVVDNLRRYGLLRSPDRLFSSAFAEFVKNVNNLDG